MLHFNASVGRRVIFNVRKLIDFAAQRRGTFSKDYFSPLHHFRRVQYPLLLSVGAVPIILVDGESIVDLMIEKEFGVQVDMLSIPSYALDLALGERES